MRNRALKIALTITSATIFIWLISSAIYTRRGLTNFRGLYHEFYQRALKNFIFQIITMVFLLAINYIIWFNPKLISPLPLAEEEDRKRQKKAEKINKLKKKLEKLNNE